MTTSPAADRVALGPRSTLLLGFGGYGEDVQRRLLASAAARGMLVWEDPPAGIGERRLRDLALLTVVDGRADGGRERRDRREGGALDLLKDLYQQIESVDVERVAERAAAAAEALLSMSRRAHQGRQQLPLGLDVVLLARPERPELVGRLDALLLTVMARLAGYSNLDRGVAGAEVLNYVAVYDFASYWNGAPAAADVRRALHRSVVDWRGRRQEGRPALGRLYLVDGATEGGLRESDEQSRIEEASLLLELLLFEGQRAGPLQRLIQSAGAHESPLATFGVRLMERSSGLLKRLAAARFGVGWLDYLARREARAEAVPAEHLRRTLDSFRLPELHVLLRDEERRELVRRRIEGLETEIRERLPPEDPAWPRRVMDRWRREHQVLADELAEWANERMLQISQRDLAGLSDELRRAVEADLHHDRHPVPLGQLLTEVEGRLEKLRREAPPAIEAAPDPRPAFQDLAALHGSYLRLRRELVDADVTRRRAWPVLATVLAAVATPWLRHEVDDAFAALPTPDPTDFFLPLLLELRPWVTSPVVLAVLTFGVAWWVGRRLVEPRIRFRVERSRSFFEHEAQGRILDVLRRLLAPEGALGRAAEVAIDRRVRDLELTVRAVFSRELGKIAKRLRDRQREMTWLREQLRLFLGLHGVGDVAGRPEQPLGVDPTGIRFSLARRADLDEVLASHPPIEERFRGAQSVRRPFAGWEQEFHDLFLYPMRFIDWLSSDFKDPLEEELATARAAATEDRQGRQFLQFLDERGRFGPAFSWKKQEGVPTLRWYCFMPAAWRRVGGLVEHLQDVGVTQQNVEYHAEPTRAYLLVLQQGAAPETLLDATPVHRGRER